MKKILFILSIFTLTSCVADYVEDIPQETTVSKWSPEDINYINEAFETIQTLYSEVPNGELLTPEDDSVTAKLEVIFLYMHQGPFMDTIEETEHFERFLYWCEDHNLTYIINLYNNGI